MKAFAQVASIMCLRPFSSGERCGYDCLGGCGTCSGWSSADWCTASADHCTVNCHGHWCDRSSVSTTCEDWCEDDQWRMENGQSHKDRHCGGDMSDRCGDCSYCDSGSGGRIGGGSGSAPKPTPAPFVPVPVPAPSPSPPASVVGRCDSAEIPKDSRCTGCPPMKDGKLCASTTRYNDPTKGACGCGNTDPVPDNWWTKTSFTAALNCKNLDPSQPEKAWCPSQCGGCYRLCNTGGTTQGTSKEDNVCHVFKVENRCGDGFDAPRRDYWCSQQLSWHECQSDPERCKQHGNTNSYGYTAHFDLQDRNLQITRLGWNNAEVTFEPVACSEMGGTKLGL